MGFGSMKPGSQSTRTSSGLRVGSPNVAPNQSGFGAGLVRPHPHLCTACSALIHGVTFAPPESRITTPIIQQKNHPRQCALILRLALAGTLKRQCVQITEAVGSRRRTRTNGNVRQWSRAEGVETTKTRLGSTAEPNSKCGVDTKTRLDAAKQDPSPEKNGNAARLRQSARTTKHN